MIDGVAQLNNIRVVFKKDGSSVDKSFEEGCPGDELEVKCDDAKHTPFVQPNGLDLQIKSAMKLSDSSCTITKTHTSNPGTKF